MQFSQQSQQNSTMQPITFQPAVYENGMVSKEVVDQIVAQSQNYANECVILSQENQKLQNSIQSDVWNKVLNAQLSEELKYNQIAFCEDSIGTPLVLKTNQAKKTVAYTLSQCKNFVVKRYKYLQGNEILLEISFTDTEGKQKTVSISQDEFTCKKVYELLYREGCTVCYGANGKPANDLLYEFIATKIPKAQCYVLPPQGWSLINKTWQFRGWNDLNMKTPLISEVEIRDSNQLIFKLIQLAVMLSSRDNRFVFDKPVFMKTNQRPPVELSIDEKPLSFKNKLRRLKEKSIIYIDSGFLKANDYKQIENCILITQALGIHFSSSEQKLLGQCRYKFSFRPTEYEASTVAQYIDVKRTGDIVRALRRLETGEFLVTGPIMIKGKIPDERKDFYKIVPDRGYSRQQEGDNNLECIQPQPNVQRKSAMD